MTLEEKAIAVGNDRKALHKRLLDAKSVLSSEARFALGHTVFSFDEKALIGEKFRLQWLVRECPDQPVSYMNQQTSEGTVVFRLNRKAGGIPDVGYE